MKKRIFGVLLCFIFCLYACSKKPEVSTHSSGQVEKEQEMKKNEEKNEQEPEITQESNLPETIINDGPAIPLQQYNQYEISTETFENIDENKQINISIPYPQLEGFKDETLQTEINNLIKEAALKPYLGLVETEETIAEGTEWPVEYTVTFASNEIISIQFGGYMYTQGSANGSDWIYSVNIDLVNGKKIMFDEIFDDSFKSKIDYAHFKECLNGVDVEKEADEKTVNEVMSLYRDGFETSDDNFYFTANKLIIILPIHGDICFSSNYKNLETSMKKENPLWGYILDAN